MDFTAVCRTCLGNTTLNPLFSSQDYSRDIYQITDVKVECDDGLPQSICSRCIHILNNVTKFRNQCRATEEQLLKIQNGIWYSNCIEQNVLNIKEEFNEFVNVYDAVIEIENTEEVAKVICNGIETINTSNVPEVVVKSENTESKLDIEDVSKVLYNNVTVYSCEVIENPKEYTEQKRGICEMCYKNLSVRSIGRHMDTCHPGAVERKVKCELCNTFVLKYKQTRHNLIMHGIVEKKCVKMDEGNKFSDKTIRQRELATERMRKYRKRIQNASKQLDTLARYEPTADEIARIEEQNAKQRRELARERSRRYREKKRHDMIQESQTLRNRRIS